MADIACPLKWCYHIPAKTDSGGRQVGLSSFLYTARNFYSIAEKNIVAKSCSAHLFLMTKGRCHLFARHAIRRKHTFVCTWHSLLWLESSQIAWDSWQRRHCASSLPCFSASPVRRAAQFPRAPARQALCVLRHASPRYSLNEFLSKDLPTSYSLERSCFHDIKENGQKAKSWSVPLQEQGTAHEGAQWYGAFCPAILPPPTNCYSQDDCSHSVFLWAPNIPAHKYHYPLKCILVLCMSSALSLCSSQLIWQTLTKWFRGSKNGYANLNACLDQGKIHLIAAILGMTAPKCLPMVSILLLCGFMHTIAVCFCKTGAMHCMHIQPAWTEKSLFTGTS